MSDKTTEYANDDILSSIPENVAVKKATKKRKQRPKKKEEQLPVAPSPPDDSQENKTGDSEDPSASKKTRSRRKSKNSVDAIESDTQKFLLDLMDIYKKLGGKVGFLDYIKNDPKLRAQFMKGFVDIYKKHLDKNIAEMKLQELAALKDKGGGGGGIIAQNVFIVKGLYDLPQNGGVVLEPADNPEEVLEAEFTTVGL